MQFEQVRYIVSEFSTEYSDHFPYECEPSMLKYVSRHTSTDGKRTWYYWPKRRYNSPEEAVDALAKWCREHAPVTGTDNTVAGVPFSNDRTFGYIAGQHNGSHTPVADYICRHSTDEPTLGGFGYGAYKATDFSPSTLIGDETFEQHERNMQEWLRSQQVSVQPTNPPYEAMP